MIKLKARRFVQGTVTVHATVPTVLGSTPGDPKWQSSMTTVSVTIRMRERLRHSSNVALRLYRHRFGSSPPPVQ